MLFSAIDQGIARHLDYQGSWTTSPVCRTERHHVHAEIQGTGKDGRVLKEDVNKHVAGEGQREQPPSAPTAAPSTAPSFSREDKKVQMTAVQSQMFKLMTKSLNIPHFLYSTAADMGALTNIRQRLNAKAPSSDQKITHLSFILKAVSLAMQHHPLLNSSLNTSDPKKPELTISRRTPLRGSH